MRSRAASAIMPGMVDKENLLLALSLAEKASLTNGNGMWTVPGIERQMSVRW